MINIRVSGENIYINNEGLLIANFIRKINEIEVCGIGGKWTSFSGNDAIRIKEKLDALCDKQCPKCLSTDVKCIRVSGQAHDLYRWNCNYCGILSEPNKIRKDAYDNWHGDQYEK